MTASQMRIAETIDAFYGDAGAKDGVSRSYKQAVEDLDTETIKALDGPYRTTVLDPITRFCAYFPDVNECTTPFHIYTSTCPKQIEPAQTHRAWLTACINTDNMRPCIYRH